MSFWDTSALVKLYTMEPDSAQFQALTTSAHPLVIARIAHYEALAVFLRREAEQALPPGEAQCLMTEIATDIAAGKIVTQKDDADVEREFGQVLAKCLTHRPPIFLRTNDALLIASAIAAGETAFVTGDGRQRAAAEAMGLVVLP